MSPRPDCGAPGILHAIGRLPRPDDGKEVVDCAVGATQFLARVGHETSGFEPDETLRRESIHVMVRFIIGRYSECQAAFMPTSEVVFKFFGEHPQHFWRCMVSGDSDVTKVQRFVHDCWDYFCISRQAYWQIPDETVMRAGINCRMRAIIHSYRGSAIELYSRVITNVRNATLPVGSSEHAWRQRFLEYGCGISPHCNDREQLANNLKAINLLCSFARHIARGTDSIEHWEASALLDAFLTANGWWPTNGKTATT